MTPDELANRCRSVAPGVLRSVILYGSAAVGDFVPGRSDYNVLAIFDTLGPAELRHLTPIVREWTRAGNRAPLMLTTDELLRSTDAFPLELLDIQDSHRVLFGEPLPAGLKVKHDALRHELERELKGRLLHLRECYSLAAGRRHRVIELLVESLSNFLVLFRAALRLYQHDVPAAKLDALLALSKHIEFAPEPFATIQQIKAKTRRGEDVVANDLFASYLTAIERIISAVDFKLHFLEQKESQP
jgi:hypothetical protein